MNWMTYSLVAVVALFVLGIVAGRTTRTIPHKAAFVSGILGLLATPVLFAASVLSLCIAGACRDGFGPADYVGVAWLALAVVAFVSLIAIGVRGRAA